MAQTPAASAVAMAGVDPLDVPAPPKAPEEIPGPADPLTLVAPGEPPLWAPLGLKAGDPLHPGGVLLHPAGHRSCLLDAHNLGKAQGIYTRQLQRCRAAILAVPEAVPDPVVLRCPECEADPVARRERLLWGGGGLLGGVVVGVLLVVVAGR